VSGNGAVPLRVLVVDDEPDVRLLLGVQLAQAGFEVVGEATDGAQAVSQFEEQRPDAVVLDLLMPGVSGFEAIPLLRAVDPAVGIVAYTAVAGEIVRKEMARQQIPLVLKTGRIGPLARALHQVASATT
jgi:two-component system, NarL family, nitrate/nitrite response regulator NarL